MKEERRKEEGERELLARDGWLRVVGGEVWVEGHGWGSEMEVIDEVAFPGGGLVRGAGVGEDLERRGRRGVGRRRVGVFGRWARRSGKEAVGEIFVEPDPGFREVDSWLTREMRVKSETRQFCKLSSSKEGTILHSPPQEQGTAER